MPGHQRFPSLFLQSWKPIFLLMALSFVWDNFETHHFYSKAKGWNISGQLRPGVFGLDSNGE